MPTRVLPLSTCLFAVVVFALLSQYAAAQTAPIRVQQPIPVHPGGVAPGARPHQEPCWQVAGISRGAMQQRQAIQRRTRSEVEAVCAEASLTPQQRQEKIRQIRQQSKAELDALVSPSQMEELKSCQMSRNHGGVHGGHPGVGGGHGPCGELPAKVGPKPPPPGSKPEDVEPEEN
jgi:hypothetical protein